MSKSISQEMINIAQSEEFSREEKLRMIDRRRRQIRTSRNERFWEVCGPLLMVVFLGCCFYSVSLESPWVYFPQR